MACARCKCRDCGCIKRCLRCFGIDKFDDFEMMVLVHEAFYTSASKGAVSIRIKAGYETVETDANSKGNFQQPLTIFVEQGSSTITIDLLDSYKKVLSKVTLDTLKDVLKMEPSSLREKVYTMKQNAKGIMNPRVKLTMVVNTGDDLEAPLLSGVSQEVDWLVRQQLQKSSTFTSEPGKPVSEMEMITAGCRGPLDLFSGLGKTDSVFVKVQ